MVNSLRYILFFMFLTWGVLAQGWQQLGSQGEQLFQQKDFEGAIKKLTGALASMEGDSLNHEKEVHFLNLIGAAHFQKENLKEAEHFFLSALQKAYTSQSKTPEELLFSLLVNLSTFYRHIDLKEYEARYLRELVETIPLKVGALIQYYQQLIFCLDQQGRYSEELSWIQKSIELSRNEEFPRKTDFLKFLDDVLAKYPAYLKEIHERAMGQFEKGDIDGALKLSQYYFQLSPHIFKECDPRTFEAYSLKSLLLQEKGEFSSAKDVILQVMKMIEDQGHENDPRIVIYLCDLARVHMNQHQLDEAEKFVYEAQQYFNKKGEGLPPEFYWVFLETQGEYLEKKGEYKKALSVWNELIASKKKQGDEPLVKELLIQGDLFLLLGDDKEAKIKYELALERAIRKWGDKHSISQMIMKKLKKQS